jgi:hypothetical protein
MREVLLRRLLSYGTRLGWKSLLQLAAPALLMLANPAQFRFCHHTVSIVGKCSDCMVTVVELTVKTVFGGKLS